MQKIIFILESLIRILLLWSGTAVFSFLFRNSESDDLKHLRTLCLHLWLEDHVSYFGLFFLLYSLQRGKIKQPSALKKTLNFMFMYFNSSGTSSDNK